MSVNLKPVLALFISILIFAGLIMLADKELLDFVQTYFYNPSILKSYVSENSRDAELVQRHIFELQNKFAAALNEPAVKSSFLYNQSPDDIYERSKILGILIESTTGLQSVQFVDSNGIRLHYSTSTLDIISQNVNSTAFRNYTDDPAALPYDTVSVSANNSAKISMDEQSDRIIFSFPFKDSMDVYRGTALYNVSVRALAEKLVAQGRLKVNENVYVTEIPQGILLGSPNTSKIDILSKVSSIWSDEIQVQKGNFHLPDLAEARVTFDAGDSGMKFSLISLKTAGGIFFGRLINDSILHIPESMKNILLISMFLTFYLTLLFILNFKTNSVVLVRNRIKRLRENLFEQLYINKNGQERAKWLLELEQRREEIRSELKRGLKFNQSTEKNINGIIDKSWDELLAVISETRDSAALSGKSILKSPVQIDANTAEPAEKIEEIGDAEEIEAVDEIGDAEYIEAVEEIGDAEYIEAVEEIGDAEEIEAVEEIGDAEELSNADELIETADVEEIGEIEEEKISSEVEHEEIASAKEIALQQKKEIIVYADAKESIEYAESENHVIQHRGLIALASEIEFNRNIHVGNTEENNEDMDTELNIVSPFSSMFTSLSGEEKN